MLLQRFQPPEVREGFGCLWLPMLSIAGQQTSNRSPRECKHMRCFGERSAIVECVQLAGVLTPAKRTRSLQSPAKQIPYNTPWTVSFSYVCPSEILKPIVQDDVSIQMNERKKIDYSDIYHILSKRWKSGINKTTKSSVRHDSFEVWMTPIQKPQEDRHYYMEI